VTFATVLCCNKLFLKKEINFNFVARQLKKKK